MIVFDFFSGYGGFSQAFQERGHRVVTFDNEPHFQADVQLDIEKLDARYILSRYGKPAVILASPPCNAYSVLSISHHWNHGEPKESARKSIALVHHTLKLIADLHPKFWIMENPRGMLRKAIGRPAVTVTYCQYGASYMKPTDLWGHLPPNFSARKCRPGDSCHQATPRGSSEYAGVRRIARAGMSDQERAAISATIPHGLSLELCIAAERDLGTAAVTLGSWDTEPLAKPGKHQHVFNTSGSCDCGRAISDEIREGSKQAIQQAKDGYRFY